ncbi:sensor histidine kinase [Sabulicella glaciei]|uniref:histidine kinase n=1 Tax=Sabulicella glaciei TaxID=2984948 RepID=A0ABT3NQV1_9PROT|nr:ATP-binding protein [Roseococcus sp. MDT2-1-1]MCW8084512.1 sensor histidine kinase [Roseococcus sp. MDT2-1-1]
MVQLFLLTATTRALPIAVRYAGATVLILAAALARYALFGTEPGRPYFTFYPAIVITAAVFDRMSGFYATALSSVAAALFFVEPSRDLWPEEAQEFGALLYFVLSSLLVVSLLEALHGALKEVSERRKQAEESAVALARAASDRDTLLQEMVHRSRNDSQRLLAMIQLQAAMPNIESRSVSQALTEVSERVAAAARVNRYLESYWWSDATVNMKEFIEGLMADLQSSTEAVRPVAFQVDAEAQPLPIARAIPAGLIVNELVGNALKYAFADGRDGNIWVTLRRQGEELVLTVEDDGVGFNPGTPPQGTGIGLRLVRALAAQLEGALATSSTRGSGDSAKGAGWIVRFPAKAC